MDSPLLHAAMENFARSFFPFVVGLAVALLSGWLVVGPFLKWVQKKGGVDEDRRGIPSWIVGVFERLLAFVLVFYEVDQAYTILLGWMVAKLASNWQRVPMSGKNDDADLKIRVYTISALMAGTLSLAFGVLGGWIARQ